MDKNRLTYLYRQYINDALSEAEQEEWNAVLINPELEELILEVAKKGYYGLTEEDLVEMRGNRSKEILADILGQAKFNPLRVKLWPRIAGVAAILLVVAAGVLLYTNKANKIVQTATYSNDVVPGSVGATLTLASGKRIVLADAVAGELANEAGLSISKTADGQIVYETKHSNDAKDDEMNTLSTAKGETYGVRLSDGSLVVLNAASSLTYTTNLNDHGKRIVKLKGEAYFEVAKNKNHPFIVKSAGQEVEVLGTEFNISSYENQDVVKTTLLEGSVKLSLVDGNAKAKASLTKPTILKPNQQAIVTGANGIVVRPVDPELAVAWKKGLFMFEAETLESIMMEVARWYNVKVSYQNKEVARQVFSGSVSRFDRVSSVLSKLEKTGPVKFKLEGRKITVRAAN